MPGADVIVVGGGVVGVSVAYYLACAGARVTVLERGELGRGASYGNAGLIVPSYSVPLATPEALTQGLRWLFDPESPFTIKLRPDVQLAAWLLRFVAAGRTGTVKATIPILRAMGMASKSLFEQLLAEAGNEVGYQPKGWLYVYKTERGLEEGLKHAELVRRAGVDAVTLDGAGVRALEPAVRPDLAGGVHYTEDAHLNPARFVEFLADRAADHGATFKTHVRVTGLTARRGAVQAVRTSEGELRADHYVIAAGAWSTPLLKTIGLRIPVEPAKGYSLTFPIPETAPGRPLMLGEAHVVMTPMGDCLRMTSGLALEGFDESLDARRLQAIARAGSEYLIALDGVESSERWFGYRPLTPDSLPIIGPTARFENLILATGHGTKGVSLGPLTGKLVADLLSGQPPSVDITPVLPRRFGL